MLMLTVSPKHHRTEVQPHRAVDRTLDSSIFLCAELYTTELNGCGTDNMEKRWGILEAYGSETQTIICSSLAADFCCMQAQSPTAGVHSRLRLHRTNHFHFQSHQTLTPKTRPALLQISHFIRWKKNLQHSMT